MATVIMVMKILNMGAFSVGSAPIQSAPRGILSVDSSKSVGGILGGPILLYIMT